MALMLKNKLLKWLLLIICLSMGEFLFIFGHAFAIERPSGGSTPILKKVTNTYNTSFSATSQRPREIDIDNL